MGRNESGLEVEKGTEWWPIVVAWLTRRCLIYTFSCQVGRPCAGQPLVAAFWKAVESDSDAGSYGRL